MSVNNYTLIDNYIYICVVFNQKGFMIQRKKKKCKGKDHMAYLFSGGYCKDCWNSRNAKPIKKVSDTRKAENSIYKTKRINFLSNTENKICPITMEKATEIHHMYSGSNRSKYFLDENTWVAVSRNGHLWIHENPKEAREKGYLKSY